MPTERTPLLVLNFSRFPLTVELLQQIEKELGRPVHQQMVYASINQVKYSYAQVLDVMDNLNIEELPTDVVFHLPSNPIVALYLVIEFYARTGQFPLILELMRNVKNRDVWIFATLRELNAEINATRRNPARQIKKK